MKPTDRAVTHDSQAWKDLVRQIDTLEREGSLALALARRIFPVDASGQPAAGKWWIHPRRAEIQEVYGDAFNAAPPSLRGRVLKGYVAHYPELAWDPSSWFLDLWWQLRARRDADAKKLLKAIAAGIQAPADLGMPKHRARQKRLAWARSALKYWRREAPQLRPLLREYRATRQWASRGDHLDVARQANQLRDQFVTRLATLTGYSPTRAELDRSPLSRIFVKAASRAFGVSPRALHDRPRQSVAFS